LFASIFAKNGFFGFFEEKILETHELFEKFLSNFAKGLKLQGLKISNNNLSFKIRY
jgi:hypothetical protein